MKEQAPFPLQIDPDNSVASPLIPDLSHLRDRAVERLIWVDAVCINQADINERGHQVQIMAKIYSKAYRVIIWLGEATDNSDRALEEIRVAKFTNSSDNKKTQQAILALLQRPWFRRIWVRGADVREYRKKSLKVDSGTSGSRRSSSYPGHVRFNGD